MNSKAQQSAELIRLGKISKTLNMVENDQEMHDKLREIMNNKIQTQQKSLFPILTNVFELQAMNDIQKELSAYKRKKKEKQNQIAINTNQHPIHTNLHDDIIHYILTFVPWTKLFEATINRQWYSCVCDEMAKIIIYIYNPSVLDLNEMRFNELRLGAFQSAVGELQMKPTLRKNESIIYGEQLQINPLSNTMIFTLINNRWIFLPHLPNRSIVDSNLDRWVIHDCDAIPIHRIDNIGTSEAQNWYAVIYRHNEGTQSIFTMLGHNPDSQLTYMDIQTELISYILNTHTRTQARRALKESIIAMQGSNCDDPIILIWSSYYQALILDEYALQHAFQEQNRIIFQLNTLHPAVKKQFVDWNKTNGLLKQRKYDEYFAKYQSVDDTPSDDEEELYLPDEHFNLGDLPDPFYDSDRTYTVLIQQGNQILNGEIPGLSPSVALALYHDARRINDTDDNLKAIIDDFRFVN
eukprot:106285_1